MSLNFIWWHFYVADVNLKHYVNLMKVWYGKGIKRCHKIIHCSTLNGKFIKLKVYDYYRLSEYWNMKTER